VLEGGEAEAVGRDMLAGRLVDLGYDAASHSVVGALWTPIRNDGKGAVSVRRFESIVPGVSPKAETVGPALNRAANEVAAQVAAWMAG
jgi:cholesterol transport system auxiliary component